MIMAGEAIGRWKSQMKQATPKEDSSHANVFRLAFRTQPKPGKTYSSSFP